jgi:hypothetical protein
MSQIHPLFNFKRKTVVKRLGQSFCLILFLGLLSLVAGGHPAYAATQAPTGHHASLASWGCENDPVQINGLTYYACVTQAQPCLRERDPFSFATVGCLPYASTIFVFGQFAFASRVVNGSDIWDLLSNGTIVSDDYVNTSNFNAYSPPIPSCQMVAGPGWVCS